LVVLFGALAVTSFGIHEQCFTLFAALATLAVRLVESECYVLLVAAEPHLSLGFGVGLRRLRNKRIVCTRRS
jgi:hypothetical protein